MRTQANKEQSKITYPHGLTYQTLRLYNEKKRTESMGRRKSGIIKNFKA
jgi:hypothetical protein